MKKSELLCLLLLLLLLLFLSSHLPAQSTTVFVPTGSLNATRAEHSATLLPNGNVLLAGGANSDAHLASAEIYDPRTGVFTGTGGMNEGRSRHSETLLGNGLVLIAGGEGGLTGFLASAELYDQATGVFTTTGNLGVPREYHTATLLRNGKVLITGGFNAADGITNSAELYDPLTGVFSPTGRMILPRGWHTATLLQNGKVLVTGGLTIADNETTTSATSELYDPVTGTFISAATMTSARQLHTATLLSSGKVLVAGGSETIGGYFDYKSTAEVYDPATGLFTPTGSMVVPRADHTATILPRDHVLLVGGDTGCDVVGCSFATQTAELYDVTSGTFVSTSGSMIVARDRHTATLLSDGDVLLAGGANGNDGFLNSAELFISGLSPVPPTPRAWMGGAAIGSKLFAVAGGTGCCSGFGGNEVATTEAFDTAGNTWITGASVITPRFGLAAASVGGSLYILGGTSGCCSQPISALEKYDPASDTWSSQSSGAGRWKLSTAVTNGKIYAIGGGPNGNQNISTNEIDEYDPSMDTWATKSPMPTSRYGAASDTIDGKIYVAGGFTGIPTPTLFSTLEIYDPTADNWLAGTSMPTSRMDLATVAVASKLYAIGGWNPLTQQTLATVEVYDPSTSTWTTQSPMPTARSGLVAVAINGKIYAYGGIDQSNHVLATLEVYDPTTNTWSTPGGATSFPPTILSISPVSGTQGQTILNFTVNGSNFDPLAVLSFSGSGITANSYSTRTGAQIVASITISSAATLGPRDVTVTNPNSQTGILSGGLMVTAAPPPSVLSISPTSGTQGQTISAFTVTGANFNANSVLSFSNNSVVVNSYAARTASQIVASITIGVTVPPGAYDVVVTNSDGQKATVNGGFTVLPNSSISTITVRTNTPSATFTLKGPVTLSGSGTSASFTAPPGLYTITYGPPCRSDLPANATLTLLAGSSIAFQGSYSPGFLAAFPLPGQNACTAKINSVFDHNTRHQYCSNSIVRAYTGEEGDQAFGSSLVSTAVCSLTQLTNKLFGFKQKNGALFSLHGQYVGAGTRQYLFYDGHPGYDYRAACHTPVYAAVSGTVQYPPSIPGANNAAKFHVLEIDPDSPNDSFRVYYLHLSTYPQPSCPNCSCSSRAATITAGKHVNAGDLVGESGDAGVPGQPHLHFEVQVLGLPENSKGVPVDPYGWQGAGVDPYPLATNKNLWK